MGISWLRLRPIGSHKPVSRSKVLRLFSHKRRERERKGAMITCQGVPDYSSYSHKRRKANPITIKGHEKKIRRRMIFYPTIVVW